MAALIKVQHPMLQLIQNQGFPIGYHMFLNSNQNMAQTVKTLEPKCETILATLYLNKSSSLIVVDSSFLIFRLEIVTELASSKPMAVSYLHSFFMTENYVIFTEQPWILGDLGKMIYEHVFKGK